MPTPPSWTSRSLPATINRSSPWRGLHYSGRTRISHFLWVLYEDIGIERLRQLVVNPLTGLTVAAFYGCHITRPPGRYGFVDSRNNVGAGTACPRFSAAGRSTTAAAPNAAASTPPPTTRGSRSS